MSTIITGQVAVVTKNRYGYGMKVEGNEQWFNSKFDPNCSKGDMVSFDSKGKNYIDGLTVTGAAPPSTTAATPAAAGGHDKRQTSIVRQNAVTNANAFCVAQSYNVRDISELIELAKQIEVYTLGNPEETAVLSSDDEQAEALKALAAGTA